MALIIRRIIVNELDDSLRRIVRRKRCEWAVERSASNRPFEFTPLSDRGRTASVGLKSDGTRRVSTWTPRLPGLNGAGPRLVGIGWRWRWRHYIDCPAHAAPRGSPKIVLFLSSCPFLWHPFHSLALRCTGRGKNYLQDMQKRKIFTNLSAFVILLMKNFETKWIKKF